MRVVPALDPLKHRHLCFRLGLEAAATEQLSLQGREEALGHRVVVGIPHRAHRGHHSGLLATFSERVTCVLAAAVGMMDHALGTALH